MMKGSTLEYLLKELKPEFHEWVHNKEHEKDFCVGAYEWMETYVKGSGTSRQGTLKRVVRACSYLGIWYINLFQDKALNEDEVDPESLALSMKYYSWSFAFHYYLTPEFPNNPPVMTLNKLAEALSAPLLLGGRSRSVQYYKWMLELLADDPYGGYISHLWFMLHMLADWQHEELDKSRYAYPKDMKVYSDILKRWRTEDIADLDQLVYQLADFHIQESWEMEEGDIPEFGTRNWWLFPYEILSMLRLREWIGLENPKNFSHPLMQLPQNKLPESFPDMPTPLLSQVVKKFEKEFNVKLVFEE